MQSYLIWLIMETNNKMTKQEEKFIENLEIASKIVIAQDQELLEELAKY